NTEEQLDLKDPYGIKYMERVLRDLLLLDEIGAIDLDLVFTKLVLLVLINLPSLYHYCDPYCLHHSVKVDEHNIVLQSKSRVNIVLLLDEDYATFLEKRYIGVLLQATPIHIYWGTGGDCILASIFIFSDKKKVIFFYSHGPNFFCLCVSNILL
ncbi:hypothetical protein ACJX0J_013577, partial [Zea mays]